MKLNSILGVLAGITFSLSSFADGNSLPENVLKAHQGQMECDQESITQSEVHPLPQKAQLFLVPCIQGAYNTGFKGYVLNEQGEVQKVMILEFNQEAKAIIASDDLINAQFDSNSLQLLTLSKGRGVADCGTSTVNQIKISEFGTLSVVTKLIRSKSNCDGLFNEWPIVFKQK